MQKISYGGAAAQWAPCSRPVLSWPAFREHPIGSKAILQALQGAVPMQRPDRFRPRMAM